MSRPPLWRCMSCPVILGEVVAGILRPFVVPDGIGQGRTVVTCPRCKAQQVWTDDVQILDFERATSSTA